MPDELLGVEIDDQCEGRLAPILGIDEAASRSESLLPLAITVCLSGAGQLAARLARGDAVHTRLEAERHAAAENDGNLGIRFLENDGLILFSVTVPVACRVKRVLPLFEASHVVEEVRMSGYRVLEGFDRPDLGRFDRLSDSRPRIPSSMIERLASLGSFFQCSDVADIALHGRLPFSRRFRDRTSPVTFCHG